MINNKLINNGIIYKIAIALIAIILINSLTFNGLNKSVAKSNDRYNIKDMNVNVLIRENGTVDVEEKFSIEYKDLNTLTRTFSPSVPIYNIKNVQATVTDENGERMLQKAEVKEKQAVGFYHFGKYKNDLEIGVGVKKSEDYQTANLKYRYTLDGFVQVHNDVAELYYKILDSSNKVPMKRYHMEIAFEKGPVNKNNAYIWAHTDVKKAKGEIQFTNNGRISLDLKGKLESGVFLEPRILFPKEYVSGISSAYVTGRDMKENIIAEENGKHKKSLEEAESLMNTKTNAYKGLKFLGAPILGIMSLYSLFVVGGSRKDRKQFLKDKLSNTKDFEYFTQIPEKVDLDLIRIALFNERYDNKEYANLFAASILKMQYLGVIDSVKGDIEKQGIFGAKTEEGVTFTLNRKTFEEMDSKGKLQKFDKAVFDIMTSAAIKKGSGDVVNNDQLFRHLKNTRDYYNKIYMKNAEFIKDAKERLESEGLMLTEDEYKAKFPKRNKAVKYSIISFLLGFVLIVASILIMNFMKVDITETNPLFFIIPPAIIGLLALMGTSITDKDRYNEETLQAQIEVKALKSHLKDFSLMDELGEEGLVKWEKYLIYATAFGISDEVYKKLQDKFPEIAEHLNDVYAAPLLISGGFSTSIATSIGSGGGLSSGGGGGFGGGGFGGR